MRPPSFVQQLIINLQMKRKNDEGEEEHEAGSTNLLVKHKKVEEKYWFKNVREALGV